MASKSSSKKFRVQEIMQQATTKSELRYVLVSQFNICPWVGFQVKLSCPF